MLRGGYYRIIIRPRGGQGGDGLNVFGTVGSDLYTLCVAHLSLIICIYCNCRRGSWLVGWLVVC